MKRLILGQRISGYLADGVLSCLADKASVPHLTCLRLLSYLKESDDLPRDQHTDRSYSMEHSPTVVRQDNTLCPYSPSLPISPHYSEKVRLAWGRRDAS